MSERPETRTQDGTIGAISAEALLEHSRWLGNLARALVRAPDDAEDLVQQTYAHALAAPPKHAQNLRGWLARIARNVASSDARDRQRREERELAAPRPEPPATPEEAVARVELRRRVVEAVLALAEPYRATLVMRFFDEMSAEEIARATATPIETVRTRVKRALEQLRVRLDRERDREGKSLAALLVAFANEGAAGAIVMSVGSKVLVSAAAVLLAGVTWWAWPASSAPIRGTNVAANEASAVAATAPPAPVVATASRTPEPVASREPPESVEVAAVPASSISGVVRDLGGLAIGGASVFLYEHEGDDLPEGRLEVEFVNLVQAQWRIAQRAGDGKTEPKMATSDRDGRFEFADTGSARGWCVGAWKDESGAGLVRLEPDPSGAAQVAVDLVLRPLASVRGRVVDAAGNAAPGAMIGWSLSQWRSGYLQGRTDGGSISGSLGRIAVADERGEFVLPPALFGRFELRASLNGAALSNPVSFDLTPEAPEKRVELVLGSLPTRKLQGRLVASDGTPAQIETTILAPMRDYGDLDPILLFWGFSKDPGVVGTNALDDWSELFDDDLTDDAYSIVRTKPETRFLGVVLDSVLIGKAAITEGETGPDIVVDGSVLRAVQAIVPPTIVWSIRIDVPEGPADPPLRARVWTDMLWIPSASMTGSFPADALLERGRETSHELAMRRGSIVRIRVQAPGFATAWTPPMHIGDEQRGAEIPLTLRVADSRVQGEVKGRDDQPLAAAQVEFFERVDGSWRRIGPEKLVTTKTGHFETSELAEGDVLVVVRGTGLAASTAIVHATPATEPLSLRCAAGIVCTLEIPKGDALCVQQQLLRVLDADGAPVHHDLVEPFSQFRKYGRYDLRLLPGHYTAELTVPSGAVATQEFDVDSAATTVTLALPR